ncbi:polyphosphate kinase 2 family protein [Haloferula sp. A504]|jgi:PPK2 family polyphosphate:nucleotide phosphotransferase|uniref:polyphosphate kinase 2 family protein n=1 Tax=Haloferula sp. A504 TaxID=3373601 RepID=UPI0031C93354|nr:polyphosphate kinase 2 family protein [Verrucomicrobiaceae bacterium E54]
MSKKDQTHRLDHKPFLANPGGKFRLTDHDPRYSAGLKSKKEGKKALADDIDALSDAQRRLWADGRHSVLIILQAMDAAGKDGTIRHVMSGVNPQGVAVHGFKAPNEEERQHHFLWRPTRFLPRKGSIAIFNRSYYEETLVVRVHPEFLEKQFLSARRRQLPLPELWRERYEDINAYEKALVHNDTLVLKFFLNVSKDEQRERFLDRLNEPDKHWKFSAADLSERGYWDDYQQAYQDMIAATSTEHAPWYVIPADRKWFARAAVADIIAERISRLDLRTPEVSEEDRKQLAQAREVLLNEK